MFVWDDFTSGQIPHQIKIRFLSPSSACIVFEKFFFKMPFTLIKFIVYQTDKSFLLTKRNNSSNSRISLFRAHSLTHSPSHTVTALFSDSTLTSCLVQWYQLICYFGWGLFICLFVYFVGWLFVRRENWKINKIKFNSLLFFSNDCRTHTQPVDIGCSANVFSPYLI